MTKLKTLKDFTCGTKEVGSFTSEINPDLIDVIIVDVLKAEAVKWVKSERASYMNAIDILLVFFNLTEEELGGKDLTIKIKELEELKSKLKEGGKGEKDEKKIKTTL